MTYSLPFISSSALLVVALSAQPTLAQPLQANTWTVLAGQVVRYNTSNGPLILDSLQIDPGGILRVHGSQPFRVLAHRVQIDGTLDLSGFDAKPVFTLNMTSTPSPAAEGGPSGGIGGRGSLSTRRATLQGEDGKSWAGVSFGGGRGGESGWSLRDVNAGGNRHAAGGGGGQFGPSELIFGSDPESLVNVGRIALGGVDGSVQATGALSGSSLPLGGSVGVAHFVDSDPSNDFYGTKIHSDGSSTVGELQQPQGGEGGGAGGDSWYEPSGVFPPSLLIHSRHDKGAGGGGGGGLAMIVARRIIIGSTGQLLAGGGDGAGGENTSGVNRIGGGSGAGSGGMIILQAMDIDLSSASSQAFQALGGKGGEGSMNQYRAVGAGGNGGPGLIQLHVPGGSPAHVSLPAGVSLDELSAPHAHLLGLQAGL